MISLQDTLLIGTLKRTHGTQGEVQCLMINEEWEKADADFLILNIDQILVPFRVLSWRSKGAESLIFRLQGIDSEIEAKRLVGAEARMLRQDLAEPDDRTDDEMMSWQELTGYKVMTSDGKAAGIIDSIDDSTANILAHTESGHLFPLHEDLIAALDSEQRILQLTLTELF